MNIESDSECLPEAAAQARGWSVYLILCADHSLYCGISNRPAARFAAHAAGKGARYTRARPPLEMRIAAAGLTRAEALKTECRIKKLKAAQKREMWETLHGLPEGDK